MLTPTEELKIASAYLNAAEEGLGQAAVCLNRIQGRQATYALLLSKFQVTFKHLQTQLSQIESLIPGQNGQQDL